MKSTIIFLNQSFDIPSKKINNVSFILSKKNTNNTWMRLGVKAGFKISSANGNAILGINSASNWVSSYTAIADETVNIYVPNNIENENIVIEDITLLNSFSTSVGAYTGFGTFKANLIDFSLLTSFKSEGDIWENENVDSLKYLEKTTDLYATMLRGVFRPSKRQHETVKNIVLPNATLYFEDYFNFNLQRLSTGLLVCDATELTITGRIGLITSKRTENLDKILNIMAKNIDRITSGYSANFGIVTEIITEDMLSNIAILKQKFTKVTINEIDY